MRCAPSDPVAALAVSLALAAGCADPPVQISAGGHHACVRLESGKIRCKRYDRVQEEEAWNYGEDDAPPGRFTAVSAGFAHTCALDEAGAIRCWGWDAVLGTAPIPEGTFQQVSAGSFHTCALRDDGLAQCWGSDNYYGDLDVPDQRLQALAAGSSVACSLTEDSALLCWGRADMGQSDPPTGAHRGLDGQQANFCAIHAEDNTLSCWGDVPTPPPAGEYSMVTSGYLHSCALKPDGEAICWGDDTYGQSSPPDDTFLSIDAGMYFTCGITDRSTTVCWGCRKAAACFDCDVDKVKLCEPP